tara:strand:- start:119 stop:385 length:267 start_codon:yes stop_codon:yes gene_type:complete
MQKDKIIEELIERKLFLEDDIIVLADGYEEAIIGVTATKPMRAIYDFWKCLDITIKEEEMNFDDALDFLNEFIEEDMGGHSPLYIKNI